MCTRITRARGGCRTFMANTKYEPIFGNLGRSKAVLL